MDKSITLAEEIPQEIREHVLRVAEDGDVLHKCETPTGVEWWLLNSDGNLIDAYWMEDVRPS